MRGKKLIKKYQAQISTHFNIGPWKKWMVLKNITGKNDHVLQNKYPRRNHDCLLEKLKKKNKYTLSVDASTTNLKKSAFIVHEKLFHVFRNKYRRIHVLFLEKNNKNAKLYPIDPSSTNFRNLLSFYHFSLKKMLAGWLWKNIF